MISRLLFTLAVLAWGAPAASITNGTFDNTCASWTPTAGFCHITGNPDNSWVLNESASPVSDPAISQTVSGLIVGNTYTLSGDYRNFFACCATFPVANAFGVEIDGVLREFTISPGGPSAPWQTFSFNFTYTGTSSLLRLSAERNSTDADVAVDNIAIADFVAGGTNGAEVPEPGTAAMFAPLWWYWLR